MKKLEHELAGYAATDAYPFHMPGHKRRMPWALAHDSGARDALARAAMLDITEIDGFDNLHAPEDLIRGEMEFAARYYGAMDTFFSVNGSTCAILTAISAAVPRGGTILIERCSHISVYHAAYLRGLTVRYLPRERYHYHENVSRKDPDFFSGADAVVITSPSYEGFVKNVSQAADEAHAAGAVLIVDEAHGAHFSGNGYFPESAVHLGADLVIESMHKTLPALT
ncbi:MAG: decarboxylase, partial [Lachnospiraceae bacterium]|nr:decarboxylase [Lachnospiraceae bacterium]